MANTTFSGPVRSENGFIGATKNASTGAFTNVFAISSTGAYTGTKLVAQGTADVIPALKSYYNIDFNVPLDTELKIGYNWLDMKEAI